LLSSAITQGGDQVLLPFGESHIDWAAARFVMNITAQQWTRLEEILQSLVLSPLGGLYAICQKTGDLISKLSDQLIDQTAAYLNQIEVGDMAEASLFRRAACRSRAMVPCYERAAFRLRRTDEQSGLIVQQATRNELRGSPPASLETKILRARAKQRYYGLPRTAPPVVAGR
jgi:hypothetical protein